jgi:hypothetical protein
MPRLKIRKFRGLNLNQAVPDEPAYLRDLKNTRVVNGEMHVRDGWQRLRNTNQDRAHLRLGCSTSATRRARYIMSTRRPATTGFLRSARLIQRQRLRR